MIRNPCFGREGKKKIILSGRERQDAKGFCLIGKGIRSNNCYIFWERRV